MDGNIATFSEFARMLGVKPSAITALRKDGRLVLTEDAKHLLVLESQQRIRETADPSKAAVAARHAAFRAASEGEGQGAGDETAPGASGEPEEGGIDGGGTYQASRAMRENYLALSAKRDYEVEIGKLMVATDVVAGVGSAVAILRTSLERLPDVLGPQLAAEPDEGRARALLAEAIEHALDETARQFGILARREEA